MAKFVCPLIVVADIKKAKRFYTEILGQEIKSDFGENVVFKGDFAVHDENHFRTLIENRAITKESNSFELYFEDDSIEELAAALKEADVEFIHELKTQPWQQRVVRFYDPGRNIIEIGESLEHVCRRLHSEGKNIEEISGLTSLPPRFIMDSLSAGREKEE